MKKSFFMLALGLSILISACLIIGCGGNPTGGGGGGGGGGGNIPSADIYVSITGSDDAGTGSLESPYRTIQKGLNMAGTNEVVGVLAGTYTEEVTWPAAVPGITLRGVSQSTAILSGANTFQCIQIPTPVVTPQTITIESMTISGGRAYDGAAIEVIENDITLHIDDCMFDGNNATTEGGAIRTNNDDDILVIENSTFQNNSASDGGAMLIRGPLLITHSTIYNNTASNNGAILLRKVGTTPLVYMYSVLIDSNDVVVSGGGIYNDGCVATIECSTISNNNADINGGGVYNNTDSDTKMELVFIKNNTADQYGGGVMNYAILELERCSLESNSAGGGGFGQGGGLHSTSTGTVEVENCVFRKNTADNSAGAIYYDPGSSSNPSELEVVNCTFVSNETTGDNTSGIHINGSEGEAKILNSIFFGGGASTLPKYEIYATDTGVGTISYSNYPTGEVYQVTDGGNNTTATPEFVSIGTGDLHLSAGCPAAITGGATSEGAPDEDFEEKPRTAPYSMGAYEKD